MDRILVVISTQSDGTLPKTGLEAVTGGRNLADLVGGELVIGIVGGDATAAAGQVASAGAVQIVAVDGSDFDQARYSTDVAAIEALCRATEPSFVVAVGASRLSRALPGAAFRVGGKIDTHVSGFEQNEGKLQLTRWYYRQRMKGVLVRDQRPWFIVLDPGILQPFEGVSSSAEVTRVPVEVSDEARKTQVKEILEPPAGEQTIRPDAELLFVAGAGWTKRQPDGASHVEDAEKLIRGFLEVSKASLGGSKSMVDLAGEGQKVLSFMTHLNQIGQTGATPRHPKGLATCCHGEEPHVVGWRFVNERRAVNTNPNCGWAQGKADVLYVADAFAVMKKVNELLSGS